MKTLIRGGRVYDPTHDVDGEVRDLYIVDGRLVNGDSTTLEAAEFAPDRTIDASGRVVMAGAIDLHSHIAGPSVQRARRLAPRSVFREERFDGRWRETELVPSIGATGSRYAALGYALAIDAAISPSASRHAWVELEDLPNLDRGFLLLLANHEAILDALGRGEEELAAAIASELVRRSSSLGIKAVNPAGVSRWKSSAEETASLSEPTDGRGVSPRDVLRALARAADEIGLPHPLHIHSNRLGRAGNVDVTLETSRVLEGRHHHLAHVQFHSYGGSTETGFASAASRIAEHLDRNPHVTADIGQVMFGDAVTISADEEIEHLLWRWTGRPWVNIDAELETGCGIVPIDYRRRSWLHTLQWAVGLELFLLTENPWSLALTTDHPNGGSFLTYPLLIAHLMDRDARERAWRRANSDAISRTRLPDLDREYTLREIAIVTRSAPAKILGLDDRGHLGPGAVADVVIYEDDEDRERMFRWPTWVLRAGEVVFERGEPRGDVVGRTLYARPERHVDGHGALTRWWREHGSFDLERLGPDDALREGSIAVPARRRAP